MNEVDFSEWDPTAETDMEALQAVFDTNQNGQLDSGDDDWSLFRGDAVAASCASING